MRFFLIPLFFIIVIVLVISFLASMLRIVRESEAYVVERLGSYHATWNTGFHFKAPFIDRIAEVVTLKEIVADFEPQPVITKDNVTMQIDTVVYLKVTEPKLYAYGVVNPMRALENLTATTLRNIIGDLELDQTLTSRDVINAEMRNILDVATDPWGIKVTRVELKNILPPKDIQEAMEKQMRAERNRRETILEAEGHKQAIITRKEGDKQAMILEAEAAKAVKIAQAEAEAKSIQLVNEATAKGLQMIIDVAGKDGLLVLKQLESLEKVANGNSTKLIIPSQLTESTSGLVSTATLLKEGFTDASLKLEQPPLPEEDPCCDKPLK
ncbi:MAG: SPFH/Band 7/PHB domain protein [Holdemanella sp.]|nr:SPFH/Band 7/PHB domain protein [Holdemanella sp.]